MNATEFNTLPESRQRMRDQMHGVGRWRLLLVLLTPLLAACVDGTVRPDATSPAATGGSTAIGQPHTVEHGTGSATAHDLWQRIRDRRSLGHASHPAVEAEIAWFKGYPRHFSTVAENARSYLHYIVEEVERRELPVELALLPVIESGFQPLVYSPAAAAGLWQFMPITAERFGLRMNDWYDGRRDVVDSTRAALDYLELLARRFDGDWLLAVAAYNWGEANVSRAIARNVEAGGRGDFWSLDLPDETRLHVPRWLAFVELVSDPELHAIDLPSIENAPGFAVVDAPSQVDLAVAAEIIGIEADTMHRLNAGYTRWSTDPRGPHRLLAPASAAPRLRDGLAALAPRERVRWTAHRIASGDTLAAIAGRYRVDVADLRATNGLGGDLLRPGTELLVPVAERKLPPGVAAPRRGDTPPLLATTLHVVRAGESLWEIGRLYGVDHQAIAAANDVGRRTTIRPGQRLTIPGGDRAPAPAAREHVVRAGDSLWTIAREHDVSVADLARWNDLGKSATLHPGVRLRIVVAAGRQPPQPRRHVVKRGESLWDIARRYETSVRALARANGLAARDVLQPGQVLEIAAASAEES